MVASFNPKIEPIRKEYENESVINIGVKPNHDLHQSIPYPYDEENQLMVEVGADNMA